MRLDLAISLFDPWQGTGSRSHANNHIWSQMKRFEAELQEQI